MKKHLLLLVCFLFLLSCHKEEAATNIRLFNNTGHKIAELTLHTGSDTRMYTNINPGEYPGYQPVGKAYSYASGEAFIAGNTYSCQVIDYVGEKELGTGNFTYEVTLHDANPGSSLQIMLKK